MNHQLKSMNYNEVENESQNLNVSLSNLDDTLDIRKIVIQSL